MRVGVRSTDQLVKVWDMRTREAVATFAEHRDQVWGVAYNRDGSQLVSVGSDRHLVKFTCVIDVASNAMEVN